MIYLKVMVQMILKRLIKLIKNMNPIFVGKWLGINHYKMKIQGKVRYRKFSKVSKALIKNYHRIKGNHL